MSILDTLLFGYRRLTAGLFEAPQRTTLDFVGATLEDDPVNQRTRVIVTGDGAAPATRQIIAGAGLQGGGNLSADVTIAAKLRPYGTGGLTIYSDGIGIVTDALQGTQVVPGYGLGVKCSANGGLAIGAFGADTTAGVGIRLLPVTSSLESDTNGLRVKFLSTGGLMADPSSGGARVKIGTASGGMLVVTGTGLDVDPTKVAALSGGKHTAAQSRGVTEQAGGRIEATTSFNITALTGATAQTALLATITGVQIGDVLNFATAWDHDSPMTSGVPFMVELTSSPTAGVGTVYSTLLLNVGTTGSCPERIVAASAGTYYVHLRAYRWNSGVAAYSVTRRRIVWSRGGL